MRVGFYGNTNNYPFMLARAMRRLGHDVCFIVDHPSRLHRPENRYPDVQSYPGWIHDLSPVRYRHYVAPSARRSRALALLRSCDVLVLNGFGPSLLKHVDRPAVALLTGADLEFMANPGVSWTRNPLLRAVVARVISLQRAGIRRAKAVSFFWRGISAIGDQILDSLQVGDDRRFFLLMTDLELITPSPLPFNSNPRLFCVARLNWKMPMRPGMSPLDYKGSDIMVRGLGLFVRKTGMRLDIHFVRKGWDVAATEELVEQEGLKELVTWHEEMTQQEVLEQHRMSDVIFDTLSDGAIVAMGGLDAMAIGRPLIANGRPEFMRLAAGEPSPICQAANPEQVCSQLERLLSSREERERTGLASRRYAERWFSSDHAARICLEKLLRSR